MGLGTIVVCACVCVFAKGKCGINGKISLLVKHITLLRVEQFLVVFEG